MAKELQDTALLARIEGGDLIALEAKYHLPCLTKLRNQHRSLLKKDQNSTDGQNEVKKKQARAFSELVSYVENAVEDGTFCFKLADLRHLFENRLQEFEVEKEVNKVSFRDQILSYFPEAQVQSYGKNFIFGFDQGMQQLMKGSLDTDYDSDAKILTRAATIIRRDIFASHTFQFCGSFPSGCQQDSVPVNLKYLMSMLLNGPSLKDQASADSQACLSISQMILFNCKKRGRPQVSLGIPLS